MIAKHPGVGRIPVEDGRGGPLGRSFRKRLWPTLVFTRGGQVGSRLVRPASGAIAEGFAEPEADLQLRPGTAGGRPDPMAADPIPGGGPHRPGDIPYHGRLSPLAAFLTRQP
ncbi:hypothetical protein [Paludisphaera mucosa]|uniref:Uncharacterized protein n=1 Tax=Paludisphaera mucosa TaxID=3030827 RepID=A0ABT6FEI6_9BACT|nr:hypothetical protein [Paludisphaera mucosa]MDG3005954.1 hypothetical protein [Paludisphaera mucosa]